jgi:hypothetical protein
MTLAHQGKLLRQFLDDETRFVRLGSLLNGPLLSQIANIRIAIREDNFPQGASHADHQNNGPADVI